MNAPRKVASLVLVTGVLAVSVPVLIAMNTEWWGDPVAASTIIAGDAAALGLLGALVGAIWRWRAPRSQGQPPELADDLATTVFDELLLEATGRGLRDPLGALPLAWGTGRTGRDFDTVTAELADEYLGVKSRRLLVLGEPGSGKSALAVMLVIGLLKKRSPGTALPVLLPLASWDPVETPMLDQWITRTLADTYYSGRPDIPALLLDRGLLVPVLDGLDELVEASRGLAVKAINKAIGDGSRPLIVTCRLEEYQDVIARGCPRLLHAVTVTVQPLAPADVIRYLQRGDWPPGTSWDGVFAALRSDSGGYVNDAFSTPLIVSLARSVYERCGGQPSELLDTENFDSRMAVEDELTLRAVDAAYAPGSASPAGVAAGRRRFRRQPTLEDARRWHTRLARYLHRQGQRDIAWWQLSEHLLSRWAVLAIGIGGGILLLGLSVAVTTTFFRPDETDDVDGLLLVGGLISAAFAAGVLIVWFMVPAPAPGRLMIRLDGSLARLARGFRVGVGISSVFTVPALLYAAVSMSLDTHGWTLANILLFGQLLSVSLAVSVVLGVALALHSWLNAPPARSTGVGPLTSLRQDRALSLVSSAVTGGVVAVLGPPAVIGALVAGMLALGYLTDWPGWPGTPDRREAIHTVMVPVRSTLNGSASWTAAIVLPAVTVGSLVLLSHPWPRLIMTRLVLGTFRRLPLQLMAFLADARVRGLLRLSGSVYQFRHIRLQERLVNAETVARITDIGTGSFTVRKLRRRTVPVAVALAASLLAVSVLTARLPQDTARLVLHAGSVEEVAWGPYGRTVLTMKTATSYLETKTFQRWRMDSGRPIGPAVVEAGWAQDPVTGVMAIGRRGEGDTAGNAFETVEFRSETGKFLFDLKNVSQVMFSRAGGTFASYDRSRHVVQMWSEADRRAIGAPIPAVAGWTFLAGGQALVTVSLPGPVVHLWDPARGQSVSSLPVPPGGRAEKGADGDRILMSVEDNYVVVAENSQGLIGFSVPDSSFLGENSSDAPLFLYVWDPVTARFSAGPVSSTRDWGFDEEDNTFYFTAPRPAQAWAGISADSDTFIVREWIASSRSFGPPKVKPIGEADDLVLSPTRALRPDKDQYNFYHLVDTEKKVVLGGGFELVGGELPSHGCCFVSSSNGENEVLLNFRDRLTGEPVAAPISADDSRDAFELSDDGELMVTRARSGVIDLWHVWDRTLLHRVHGNNEWRIVKDQDLVITYAGDDVIRFFSASTGRPISELHGHTGAVTGIWVSPDGRSLLSAANDGTVRVWGMPH